MGGVVGCVGWRLPVARRDMVVGDVMVPELAGGGGSWCWWGRTAAASRLYAVGVKVLCADSV